MSATQAPEQKDAAAVIPRETPSNQALITNAPETAVESDNRQAEQPTDPGHTTGSSRAINGDGGGDEVENGTNVGTNVDSRAHGDETTASRDGPEPAASSDVNKGIQHRQSKVKEKVQNSKQKVKEATKPSGGFDSTPLPNAPPGFTVKFTFHRAHNLPVADYGHRASDPFTEATLTTALPKRHREDPDLVHRTPTIRRCVEPVWNDDWIVANVPASGFKLKCRLYDEDWPDHNDRLGNVTILVDGLTDSWEGFTEREFPVKKRVGSKRAYLLKAATAAFQKEHSMTPKLYISAKVLGHSDPPYGQIYTVGPTTYTRHFSPMIGRLAGIQVNKNEDEDQKREEANEQEGKDNRKSHEKRMQKYDFQAIQIQLQGPVPSRLYHRYVNFRPFVGRMFSRSGLRGRILNKALRHQHARIYNFDSTTETGQFEPCSEEASLQFLKLVHFDQGGRLFTYVITLDGLFRFTETGKEFGIDLLSKHTMHSDVATYIACSGEFLIRRLSKPTASKEADPDQPTHPSSDLSGGPPHDEPPAKPEYYQLIIDNDSGTYRPDKSILPELRTFLEKNFPRLGIVTLGCDDDEDQKLKETQRQIKKKEGQSVPIVMNRSPSSSSLSSDDISDLEDLERAGDKGRRSKKQRVYDLLEHEDPVQGIKDELRSMPLAGGASGGGGGATQKETEAGPST